MGKITIDPARCTNCNTCVLSCPAVVFKSTKEDPVPEVDHEELCISCGHCVAICPEAAIAHVDFPQGSVKPIRQDLVPSVEQILEALRMRRSIRVFTDDPVRRELIEKVIDGARLAPSAHNVQSTEYIVVRDKAVLHKIVQLTARYFAKTARQLRNPTTRTLLRMVAGKEVEGAVDLLPDFDLIAEAVQSGKDPILRGAPCFLVFHAEQGANFSVVNANLALHNATLVCQALGLGSFYTGYVVGACKRDKSIPELLSIPDGHQIYAAMALGHPRFEFRNWIERRPPQVEWI